MLDFVAQIRSPLIDRLEAVSRARSVPVPTLVEEAVRRLLETEEHCEALHRAFADFERRNKKPAQPGPAQPDAAQAGEARPRELAET
ncbi:hypothetical protein [Arenibaculum pallidiluteum]|uniref:hypothetical protein n=1 Tax=Arenibaculum pallidiluteum TaxID=2812559 RepID=UPI001A96AA63|nr:hypothetical protein [Arenibaculum pallidiluteum]